MPVVTFNSQAFFALVIANRWLDQGASDRVRAAAALRHKCLQSSLGNHDIFKRRHFYARCCPLHVGTRSMYQNEEKVDGRMDIVVLAFDWPRSSCSEH